MKKFVSIFLFSFLAIITQAQQWSLLPLPPMDRYDDVFFIGQTGWACGSGNDSGRIFKTLDGGATWAAKAKYHQKYMRSIEFASPTLGFCGSLDSSFYKSTDGGETWVDIANNIQPKPSGICGIAAPSANVIYGCGVWSQPAYIIKSTDGGNNWTSIDMSAYATALVDIHFVNEQEGFVCGKAANPTEGGVILHTTDGGNTWNTKIKTLVGGDYVWKLQTYNNKNFYASIEAGPSGQNVRWINSTDYGNTWTINDIPGVNIYVQAIGFLDSLHGWTGGSYLMATEDGGATWDTAFVGSSYNRFFRDGYNTAYLTGKGIYKYVSGNNTAVKDNEPFDELHRVTVSPNPTDDWVTIDVDIHNKTFCQIALYSANGQLLSYLLNEKVEAGKRSIKLSLKTCAGNLFYLQTKTHEGTITNKIIRK